MRDGNDFMNEKTKEIMSDCTLCPRNCHADKLSGSIGYCGQTAEIRAARAALHMWEEPCISAEEGSGTVFFSGCSVRCVFCQNHDIAVGQHGKIITGERLSEIYLELQEKGANNINLVTPTHYVPQIIESIENARKMGLTLPIVYNTSGYEKAETLRMLDGIVDVYLPDFKYMSAALAEKYSNAPDYADCAKSALAEMVRQTGKPVFDDRGVIQKGVIVRHLILPNCTEDSKKVIKYLYKTYGDDIFISIMNQFTPLDHTADYPELQRKITQAEYDEVVDYAVDLGVENGFIQEGETADESFIPSFDYEGI